MFGAHMLTTIKSGAAIEAARCLYDRIRSGLEWLGSSASRAVRDALLAEAGAGFARSDVAALDKLLRQVHALARSVGMPLGGACLARSPADPPPPTEANASLPRWSAVSKPAEFRRREHAPLHYPWGEGPPPRPRSSSDVLPGKPEALLSANCREHLAAYRRSVALRDELESEARHRYGSVRYHGPDEPPERYWPADPE